MKILYRKEFKMSSLQQLIEKHGAENIIFMNPMFPVRKCLGLLSYTSSCDDEIVVPCKINEDRYKVSDGYKITLESTFPGFGKDHIYQMDLESLLRQGTITIYVKKNIS